MQQKVAYTKFSDFELSELLKADDRNAFTEIYERYNGLLYIYAYKKLKDKDDAQDIVQEVFVNLWNRRSLFTLNTNLAGYLYKSVLNKVFDLFAHKKITVKYIHSLQDFIDRNDAAADTLIIEKELKTLIEYEISCLPPRMQEIFELSRKGFLSHKEIAEQFGISDQTVTTQIKRALRVLRIKLRIVNYLLPLVLALSCW
jgi:RNA polymerase sigma-70 factor (family 1)